ncbi:MAG TPA: hypothetical protein VHK01_09530, partial [Lacipirellulaceae bacterium]|jgi:hypothetical protein|nr:hypothetical protein [Lacipirellulaceae bacterium]
LHFVLTASYVQAKPSVIVVVGAPGAPEYGAQFSEWAKQWHEAAKKATADFQVVGNDATSKPNDRERLQKLLGDLPPEDSVPVWLVFIGHGTFDGHIAKFNLRGPDLSAEELAAWLAPIKRPIAIIQCSSASAPFINRLAGKDRVVITATKSGDEQNFARFGQYIASTIADLRADLDKDGQVSLLEAYLTACRQLDEFYSQEARLATEHPLLDDNGDGLGTPAAWFRGLRATERAKDGATLDGTRAHQFHLVASDRERDLPADVLRRRDELELKIAALRDEKGQLNEEDYYAQLEQLMVELARVYDGIER